MSRFFDTNTYYRQPVIREKLRRTQPLILDEFLFAQQAASKPVKPVLTGPYTLAKLSINNAYADIDELMETMGNIIAQEVNDLSHAGATIIQIDEPAILQNPQDIEILHTLLKEISDNRGKAQLALYTYFGDAAPVYESLQQCPVDILGLDFTYSPGLPQVIAASGVSRTLGLGIIDGRNTKIETGRDIFPILEAILKLPGTDTCYLNPSCGLEYLPREDAFRKLKNMASLRNEFLEGKNDRR